MGMLRFFFCLFLPLPMALVRIKVHHASRLLVDAKAEELMSSLSPEMKDVVYANL